MRRAQRLRDSDDFRRVRRAGRSWSNRYLVLYVAPGGGDVARLGISVSKRVGGAVTRNLLKRRLKAIARKHFEGLSGQWDLMLVVRSKSADATFAELETALRELLTKGGLLKEVPCDAPPRA